MSKVNGAIFSGRGGDLYLQSERVAYVEEFNVKVTGDFESVECCGTYESEYVYNGYNCEGTMTIFKVNSVYDDVVLDSFKTGIMPNYTAVVKLVNDNTGEESSYTIRNINFTEISPVEIKKGVIKQSIPFKCSLPERL